MRDLYVRYKESLDVDLFLYYGGTVLLSVALMVFLVNVYCALVGIKL